MKKYLALAVTMFLLITNSPIYATPMTSKFFDFLKGYVPVNAFLYIDEPATLFLMGSGLFVAGLLLRKRIIKPSAK